jgi:hypothetical protein
LRVCGGVTRISLLYTPSAHAPAHGDDSIRDPK